MPLKIDETSSPAVTPMFVEIPMRDVETSQPVLVRITREAQLAAARRSIVLLPIASEKFDQSGATPDGVINITMADLVWFIPEGDGRYPPL